MRPRGDLKEMLFDEHVSFKKWKTGKKKAALKQAALDKAESLFNCCDQCLLKHR